MTDSFDTCIDTQSEIRDVSYHQYEGKYVISVLIICTSKKFLKAERTETWKLTHYLDWHPQEKRQRMNKPKVLGILLTGSSYWP